VGPAKAPTLRLHEVAPKLPSGDNPFQVNHSPSPDLELWQEIALRVNAANCKLCAYANVNLHLRHHHTREIFLPAAHLVSLTKVQTQPSTDLKSSYCLPVSPPTPFAMRGNRTGKLRRIILFGRSNDVTM